MNNKNLIIWGVFILILITGCNSKPCHQKYLSGKVLYHNNYNIPVRNATVYIESHDPFMNNFAYQHKVKTNSDGEYIIDYLADCKYKLYSEYQLENDTTHYSPFVYIDTSEEVLSIVADNLILFEKSDNSDINLTFESRISGVDTDSMKVIISKREGINFVKIDSFVTTDEISYLMENVETGHYSVSYEKTTFIPEFEDSATIHNKFNLPFVDGVNSIEDTIFVDFEMCEKPAIYIYPEIAEEYRVSLLFKKGVTLIKSIPNYENGWKVFVDTNGEIENKYGYLFYECIQPKNFTFQEGYCFSSETINNDLKKLLKKIGLNEIEVKDFIDYWDNRFDTYDFYKVYPILNNEINDLVELDIDPKPDSMLRVWLYFEGCQNFEELPKPIFKQFERNKRVVVEWGGVMMK